MRQRNTSGYPLQIPSLDPPIEVGAGEEIDHPARLAGFTPVDELDETEPSDDSDTPAGDGDDLDDTEDTQEATP